QDVGTGVEVRRPALSRRKAIPDRGDGLLVRLCRLPGFTGCLHHGAADRSAWTNQRDRVCEVVVRGRRRRWRWRRRRWRWRWRGRRRRVANRDCPEPRPGAAAVAGCPTWIVPSIVAWIWQ